MLCDLPRQTKNILFILNYSCFVEEMHFLPSFCKIWFYLRTKPDSNRKSSMVHHVESGEMGELLPENKEEGVEEVKEL